MKPRPIIGLTGPAGAGKDTAAHILVHRLGYTRIAFADPIKAMLTAGLGLTAEQLNDPEIKETPIDWLDGATPRRLMQTLGTEWGRTHAHPQLWLRIARRHIEQTPGPIVITDVRFENEAALVRQLGGAICHISKKSTITTGSDHISESGIQKYPGDWSICNDDSISNLHFQIQVIAGMLNNQTEQA